MNKKESIKYTGINSADKFKYTFENNYYYITINKYHYHGDIECTTNTKYYSFCYDKDNIIIITGNSDKGNIHSYTNNNFPKSLPVYVIEKIKEIVFNLKNNPNYYLEGVETI